MICVEKQIFKRCNFDFERLKSYGFSANGKNYTLSKDIENSSFRLDITISLDGEVAIKVWDNEFNEEYTNYKDENQNGEFVNKIRESIEEVLLDIKKHCTIGQYFVLDQANRIANKIHDIYKDEIEFPWEDEFSGAVFRNRDTKKWYVLFMDIDRSKLEPIEGEVSAINVKLEPEEIDELVKKDGFYRAYHMNKKMWVTIILNDTLDDNQILKYIEKSHKYTEKKH